MASANLANLLLARAAGRDTEVAIRLALGGSRPALARQFLAECGLLAAAGAALGIALAQGLSQLLIQGVVHHRGRTDARAPHRLARARLRRGSRGGDVPPLQPRPIARASRIRATGALGVRGASQDRGRAAIQRVLVTAQMALSMVLVIGALLFVRSFHRLITFDPGIRRDGITVAMLGYQTANIPRERLERRAARVRRGSEDRPGRDRRHDHYPHPAHWRYLGPRRDGR